MPVLDLDRRVGRLRVEELHSFLVLAEELHFTRAAQRLLVSPGGLSRRIRHLEEALGGRLRRRTTRSVALTDYGKEFVPAAHEIVLGLHTSLRGWR
jgi:DNA-binding transcriptional LysR family regulator